jgi:anti-sigma regulatory factor (Ser/Thr protein kinase)
MNSQRVRPLKSPTALAAALGLVLAALATAVSSAPAPVPAKVADLDRLPADLPYRLVESEHLCTRMTGHVQPLFQTVDLDGDGWGELLMSVDHGVIAFDYESIAPRIIEQYNYNVRYDVDGSRVWCGGGYDLGGDGLPELLFCGGLPDGTEWRAWAVDPWTERTISEHPLPTGPDLKADGRWDGRYYIVGVLTPAETGRGAALVIFTTVGFDLRPRGVFALEWGTGEVLWRFDMGGQPSPWDCCLRDVDADGQREIVLISGTSNNMPPGMRINGTRDDECMLLVLDLAGHLRTSQLLGKGFCGALLGVADLEPGGPLEVVTALRNSSPGELNHLCVWSGKDLLPLAKHTSVGGYNGLLLATETDEQEIPEICASTLDGTLVRYRYEGEQLVVRASCRATAGVSLLAAGDAIDAHPGTELMAVTGDGNLLLLDWEFTCLAAVNLSQAGINGRHGMIWRAGPATSYLMLDENGILGLRALSGLAPATASRPPIWQVWDGPVLAALIGLYLLLRLVRRGRHQVGGAGAAGREGAEITASAPHEPSSATGLAVPAARRPSSGKDASLPDPGTPGQPGGGVPANGSAPGLAPHVVPVDLHQLVRRLLLLREDELHREGIDVQLRFQDRADPPRPEEIAAGGGPDRSDAPASCLANPADLRFVLNNLLDNAVAALAGKTGERTIRLILSVTPQALMIEVTDTGRGIPAGEQQQVFSGRLTSRPGGGLGLRRSRELLGRYGGELRLVRSEPGGGSSFALVLPCIDRHGSSERRAENR